MYMLSSVTWSAVSRVLLSGVDGTAELQVGDTYIAHEVGQ